jgi:hypothetical protein
MVKAIRMLSRDTTLANVTSCLCRFHLMPTTSNIPSLAIKHDFHIKDHVAVNVLVSIWHLVVFSEIERTIDGLHLQLNGLLPKEVSPRFLIDPENISD